MEELSVRENAGRGPGSVWPDRRNQRRGLLVCGVSDRWSDQDARSTNFARRPRYFAFWGGSDSSDVSRGPVISVR
ncbi:hypothetical protein, partial [Methanocrinis sp.]|uniref:hypothetical protein n=1 Tax=Methanocrinis sp. TaxID=3101522 RepID=UPI003D0FFB1A